MDPSEVDAANSVMHPDLAIGETVKLLHPPLPLVGVSIDIERECQQNDSLADGYNRQLDQSRDREEQSTRAGERSVSSRGATVIVLLAPSLLAVEKLAKADATATGLLASSLLSC